MRPTTLFAALAGLTLVQCQGDVPSCARPCLDDAAEKETSCSVDDAACICKGDSFSKIQGAATGCILKECGQEVALNKVLPVVQNICKSRGSE
ncbi:hypothetical protein PENSTE_c025G06358 [Penicillium steckii]|uniref:CFEM domain-containing protein n=1 Tax=Penicillium steckii TaxID=303698 RepID=A0A1V6SQ55_9EURO|nr:hypothetical protein PENSTE_c025G06358 [Penicillium steckii]